MEGGQEYGEDSKLIDNVFARTGSYIMGKRMFEEGEVAWAEDSYETDVYVLTHEKRNHWIQKGSTTFYFINDGIESALEKAKQSAQGKDIRIQGGAILFNITSMQDLWMNFSYIFPLFFWGVEFDFLRALTRISMT